VKVQARFALQRRQCRRDGALITSNKSCKWIAEAIVGGKTYAATSRMAPSNDIARQLV